MQITSLGHSCLLLSFGQGGQTTRILVDPWLSDHATGDAMGRFPRLRFDAEVLGPVHAVFLSHAHCDHLDPYTLMRLWRELPVAPALILPVTLSFLIPVFREYLDDPEIVVLDGQSERTFRGVELLGFFDVGPEATNEEDVMVLVITHGAERVLVEADARLTLEWPEFRAYISHLMREPGITSAVYLTTENELEGTLESRLCDSLEAREAVRDAAFDAMLQAVTSLYMPTDDPLDLWQGERVLRVVHGQGLTAPHELDPRWQRVLFPVRVADRVRTEREVAARQGCRHQIDGLTVGHVHTVAEGQITQREPLEGLRILGHASDRDFDVSLAFFPELPCAPLHQGVRDTEEQRTRILRLLNDRFLPFLYGSRQPPVLHLLAAHGGAYRIRVFEGCDPEDGAQDYVLDFEGMGFRRQVAGAAWEPQEAYWANDLIDFLDGRCDEFSPFCRTQFPVEAMRLWSCMATPLLGRDLLLKRVTLHFQRAAAGRCPGSWVAPLYGEAWNVAR